MKIRLVSVIALCLMAGSTFAQETKKALKPPAPRSHPHPRRSVPAAR